MTETVLEQYSGPEITDQGLVFKIPDSDSNSDCTLIVRSIPADKPDVAIRMGGLLTWLDIDDGDDEEFTTKKIWCGDTSEFEDLINQVTGYVDDKELTDKISVSVDLHDQGGGTLLVGRQQQNQQGVVDHVLWYNYPQLDDLVKQVKQLVWFAPSEAFNRLAYSNKSDEQIEQILKDIKTDMPMDQLKQFFKSSSSSSAVSSPEPSTEKPKKRMTRQQKRALLARKRK